MLWVRLLKSSWTSDTQHFISEDLKQITMKPYGILMIQIHYMVFQNVIHTLNPLGSEVILGPLRCFDMPWHLCLFQLLITYYWPTCHFFVFSTNCATIICDQDGCTCLHLKKIKILCVVSKFWRKKCSWNKAIKPILRDSRPQRVKYYK